MNDGTKQGAHPEANLKPAIDRLDCESIFRRLVQDEIAAGRLSPLRRRKLIRFGVHLGLTPVQLGEMIQSVHKEFEPIPHYSIKLPFAPPRRRATPLAKFALVLGLVLIFEFIVLRWWR